MLDDLFKKIVEFDVAEILTFSKNLEKIESILMKAIQDKNSLISLAENFFDMLNKGYLIRNEDKDQNEISIQLITLFKILEDVKKGKN